MRKTAKRGSSAGRTGGLLVLSVLVLLAAGCDDEVPAALKVKLPHVDAPRLQPAPEGVDRVAVYLLSSGDVVLGGRTWSLSTGKPEDQTRALVALRDVLRERTAAPASREADGTSKVPLVIHGDRNTRWRYAQWIMQVCAEPTVGIYKIRFATHRRESEGIGAIESNLPKDRGIASTASETQEIPLVTVRLYRKGTEDERPENDFTRIRVGSHDAFELPRGRWTGVNGEDEVRQKQYRAVLEKVTASIRESWKQMDNDSTVRGEIKTPLPFGSQVPHGDVIRVLDCLLKAGITDVSFEGAPPPMPARGDD